MLRTEVKHYIEVSDLAYSYNKFYAQNMPDLSLIHIYLLAALYNAPLTIENYYAAQIDHDLCGRN